MNLVFGRWEYFADTKSLTKATFSMDIPMKAIKILSYKNDIVFQQLTIDFYFPYLFFELLHNYFEQVEFVRQIPI